MLKFQLTIIIVFDLFQEKEKSYQTLLIEKTSLETKLGNESRRYTKEIETLRDDSKVLTNECQKQVEELDVLKAKLKSVII